MSEAREQKNILGLLSGNLLKIIAAVCMISDHVGYLFFPNADIFRIIGRIAFPIFAYFIAEGCNYTRDRARYFSLIFALGVAFYIAYYLFCGYEYFTIFITFSLSILIIYCLQDLKGRIFCEDRKITRIILSSATLICACLVAYYLCDLLPIDYGFAGVMLPVLVSLFDLRKFTQNGKLIAVLDNKYVKLACFVVGVLWLSVTASMPFEIQIFGLLAAPLMLLYSGKRGRYRMKYFFYVFYPAHLLVLQGLYMLLSTI